MTFAFVPLYVRYLGMESYGLIGIFVTLQAWLSLVDMGLRPALGREMARYTGGGVGIGSIWNLLRSAEILTGAIASFIAVVVWAASSWLAADWVRSVKLTSATLTDAFALMGAVVALQLGESIYTSALAGLQRQVLQNVIAAAIATTRALGAAAVLMWVSPTIVAFFVWQGTVSVISLAAYAGSVYRVLERPISRPGFSLAALMAIREYAAGMAGITLLSLMLTQVDKVLLSRQLPLESFGNYVLAATLAGAMSMLSTPIGAAYYPRFIELVARNDGSELRRVYRQSTQALAAMLGGAGAMFMVFSDRILLLWTHDAALTEKVAPLLALMTIGAMLNSLTSMPYLLQLAHGWTKLTVKINLVTAIAAVPAFILTVPIYGAVGAAFVWILLNFFGLLVTAHLTHRRVLGSEGSRTLLRDAGLPVAASLATALACRPLVSVSVGFVPEMVVLAATGMTVGLAAALASPYLRTEFRELAWLRSTSRSATNANQES
ncbi:MAG: polysaccharide biosynthesis protein [Sphingomicrobium sp.]